MRSSPLILAAALGGLLAPLPLLLGSAQADDGIAARPDVLSVDQLAPGMKGYGLTVFEGTTPDKFEVEIIGVLKNFQPRQDLILIKTKHPRLDAAKVVAGMSGSPIYIGGKMIGAYAYGWTFGSEPVAGVTPIRNMLDELARPLPKWINGWPLGVPAAKAGAKQAKAGVDGGLRYAGRIDRYDLEAHAREVARGRSVTLPGAKSPLTPVATPLLVGGLSGSALGVAERLLAPLGLEPVQAGGGSGAAEAGAPPSYVDGGAIGVELISGDVSAMGLGTVTRVEGNRLVAFGHPMMQSGVTALPTSVGKVLWFLASDMRSFKIGYGVRPLGALVNDRQAAIVVDSKQKAPVIPVTMKVKGAEGAPFTTWSFKVAHEKFMTPSFMAIALGNALQATAAERQDVSWTAKSHLVIQGHGALDLEDFGVAVGGTPEAGDFIRSNLVRAVGGLMNNSFAPLIIERADMTIELRYARDILRLRGAELLDPEVEAGKLARLRLTLIPYAGAAIQKIVSVPIPRHLAGQTVTLELAPGYTKPRDVAAPETLEALIRNLESSTYPPKSLVVSYAAGAGALAYNGHVARDLPPGAFDALRPTSSSVAPEAFRSETRLVVPLPDFMTGQDTVVLSVKPVLR